METRHFTELVFFHSFWKCVKQGWMKCKYENLDEVLAKVESQIPNELFKNEFKLYSTLHTPLERIHPRINSIDHHVWSHKPDFLTTDAWSNCSDLEKILPSSFNGLMQSLSNEPSRWNEYFDTGRSTNGMVSFNEIDLLNETPLDSSKPMSIFEKLILWVNAQPQKILEIVKKFNVYNFGGFIPDHKNEFDLNFMFDLTIQFDPVLILTNPKRGSCF
jgi:hypothetical protein